MGNAMYLRSTFFCTRCFHLALQFPSGSPAHGQHGKELQDTALRSATNYLTSMLVMCDAQIWYKLGTRIILGLPMLSTPSQCLHLQAPIELTCRLLQVVARCPWHAKMPEVPISGQKSAIEALR